MVWAVGVRAQPPLAVSRRSGDIIRPTRNMASTISSKGITLSIPAKAISAQIKALTVPVALRLEQGTSTRPATGSHTSKKSILQAILQS